MLTISKAIVTGPTGAIGTALIRQLLARGISVFAVTRPGSPRNNRIPNHQNVTRIECDLADYDRLPDLIGTPCDAFFHLAWGGTFGASRNDMALQEQNVAASLKAADAASALSCGVFVGVGSQAEFGPVEGVLHPDLPCRPNTGYGAAKLAASHLTRVSCGQKGIRHEWCRVLSTFGPCDGEHTLVMSTLLKMRRGEPAPFTPGEQIWDYLYSDDVADALLAVAEKGRDGSIYCLGSGQPRKLRDYITAMRDAVDPDRPLTFGELPYYPNQVMHLEADIRNLTEDTGFTPQYTFEEGIKKTVSWLNEVDIHE